MSGDELAVLRRERKRRREAAEAYREAAREDLAEGEDFEAQVIEAYLPAELSDERARRARGPGRSRRPAPSRSATWAR